MNQIIHSEVISYCYTQKQINLSEVIININSENKNEQDMNTNLSEV